MIRRSGAEVLVVQPTRADLEVRRGDDPTAAIAAQAAETVRANLARPKARRAVEILERRAVEILERRAVEILERRGVGNVAHSGVGNLAVGNLAAASSVSTTAR